MAVEVHIDGVVALGKFAEFLEAAERWRRYRQEMNWKAPKVLRGLSGEMNSVRFVFSYRTLSDYEREEAQVSADKDYVKLAMAMPFQGRLTVTIFKEAG